MKTIIFILFSFSLFTFSCSQKSPEKQAIDNAKNISKNSKKIEKEIKKAEDKRAERIAKGDTLAMNYKDLQAYLPEQIKGFKAVGEADGQSMNAMGMSFSSASREYEKDDASMEITLMDYNAAYGLYTAATTMWAAGMSYEDDEEKVGGISLKNGKLKGWEVIDKSNNDVELSLGISDRFFMNIQMEGQKDPGMAQDLVNGMDLDGLMNR